MSEKGKVIKGLGCHIADPEGELDCEHCPYSVRATGDRSISNSVGCLNRLHMEALELIQQPMPFLEWKKLTKKTMPPVGANVILWCDLNTGAPIAVVAHVWPDGVLRFWNFHGSEELTPDQYRRTRWAEIPAPAEERYGKDG